MNNSNNNPSLNKTAIEIKNTNIPGIKFVNNIGIIINIPNGINTIPIIL